jgi:hypothetical protein
MEEVSFSFLRDTCRFSEGKTETEILRERPNLDKIMRTYEKKKNIRTLKKMKNDSIPIDFLVHGLTWARQNSNVTGCSNTSSQFSSIFQQSKMVY